MGNTTNQAYDAVVTTSKNLFLQKNKDYGTAWRVLRTISIVDQIFIKALRIRTIQEKKMQLVQTDSVELEYQGIINYAIIGMMQLKFGISKIEELPLSEVEKKYNEAAALAKQTMEIKNHDYGEAWRDMQPESFTDLILMKLLRIRQILQNDGKTLVSEGIEANYVDILNYAVFASILMV